MRIIYCFIASISTAACAPLMSSPQERPPLQGSLIQPCQDLTPLDDGAGASVLRKLVEVSDAYYVCAVRHAQLVKAIQP